LYGKESWSILLVSLGSILLLLAPQSSLFRSKVDLVSMKNPIEFDALHWSGLGSIRVKMRQLLASDRNLLQSIFERMTKFSRMNESERKKR